MTYEIGQQVETPLGVGVVKGIRSNNTKFVTVKFNDDDSMCMEFDSQYVKPYKTAHEKLIEMGFEEKIYDKAVEKEIKCGDYKQYVNYPFVILIDLNRKEFTTYTLYNDSKNNVDDVSWVSLELSHILTQYLEEMSE